MCCRLRLDLRELRKKSGGFFGSGESDRQRRRCYAEHAASRLPFRKRAGVLSERLDKLMDIAARSLHDKAYRHRQTA